MICDKFQRGMSFATALALALCSPPATALDYEPIDRITEVAADYAATLMPELDGDLEIEVAPPDRRLRLARCDTRPQAFSGPGMRPANSRLTIGVRCTTGVQWKLYVSVHVNRVATVVVARRPLAAGTELTSDDLTLASRSTSRITTGYLTNPDDLVGETLRRSVSAGTVLANGAVRRKPLVSRGQRVTIAAARGGLVIRMGGTAEGTGGRGQRILVRNLSSGRLVEGIIRSAHEVEVFVK